MSMKSAAKSSASAVDPGCHRPPKKHTEACGDHGDCPSNRGRDGADQNVPIADVAQFVGEDAFEFFVSQ